MSDNEPFFTRLTLGRINRILAGENNLLRNASATTIALVDALPGDVTVIPDVVVDFLARNVPGYNVLHKIAVIEDAFGTGMPTDAPNSRRRDIGTVSRGRASVSARMIGSLRDIRNSSNYAHYRDQYLPFIIDSFERNRVSTSAASVHVGSADGATQSAAAISSQSGSGPADVPVTNAHNLATGRGRANGRGRGSSNFIRGQGLRSNDATQSQLEAHASTTNVATVSRPATSPFSVSATDVHSSQGVEAATVESDVRVLAALAHLNGSVTVATTSTVNPHGHSGSNRQDVDTASTRTTNASRRSRQRANRRVTGEAESAPNSQATLPSSDADAQAPSSATTPNTTNNAGPVSDPVIITDADIQQYARDDDFLLTDAEFAVVIAERRRMNEEASALNPVDDSTYDMHTLIQGHGDTFVFSAIPGTRNAGSANRGGLIEARPNYARERINSNMYTRASVPDTPFERDGVHHALIQNATSTQMYGNERFYVSRQYPFAVRPNAWADQRNAYNSRTTCPHYRTGALGIPWCPCLLTFAPLDVRILWGPVANGAACVRGVQIGDVVTGWHRAYGISPMTDIMNRYAVNDGMTISDVVIGCSILHNNRLVSLHSTHPGYGQSDQAIWHDLSDGARPYFGPDSCTGRTRIGSNGRLFISQFTGVLSRAPVEFVQAFTAVVSRGAQTDSNLPVFNLSQAIHAVQRIVVTLCEVVDIINNNDNTLIVDPASAQAIFTRGASGVSGALYSNLNITRVREPDGTPAETRNTSDGRSIHAQPAGRTYLSDGAMRDNPNSRTTLIHILTRRIRAGESVVDVLMGWYRNVLITYLSGRDTRSLQLWLPLIGCGVFAGDVVDHIIHGSVLALWFAIATLPDVIRDRLMSRAHTIHWYTNSPSQHLGICLARQLLINILSSTDAPRLISSMLGRSIDCGINPRIIELSRAISAVAGPYHHDTDLFVTGWGGVGAHASYREALPLGDRHALRYYRSLVTYHLRDNERASSFPTNELPGNTFRSTRDYQTNTTVLTDSDLDENDQPVNFMVNVIDTPDVCAPRFEGNAVVSSAQDMTGGSGVNVSRVSGATTSDSPRVAPNSETAPAVTVPASTPRRSDTSPATPTPTPTTSTTPNAPHADTAPASTTEPSPGAASPTTEPPPRVIDSDVALSVPVATLPTQEAVGLINARATDPPNGSTTVAAAGDSGAVLPVTPVAHQSAGDVTRGRATTDTPARDPTPNTTEPASASQSAQQDQFEYERPQAPSDMLEGAPNRASVMRAIDIIRVLDASERVRREACSMNNEDYSPDPDYVRDRAHFMGRITTAADACDYTVDQIEYIYRNVTSRIRSNLRSGRYNFRQSLIRLPHIARVISGEACRVPCTTTDPDPGTSTTPPQGPDSAERSPPPNVNAETNALAPGVVATTTATSSADTPSPSTNVPGIVTQSAASVATAEIGVGTSNVHVSGAVPERVVMALNRILRGSELSLATTTDVTPTSATIRMRHDPYNFRRARVAVDDTHPHSDGGASGSTSTALSDTTCRTGPFPTAALRNIPGIMNFCRPYVDYIRAHLTSATVGALRATPSSTHLYADYARASFTAGGYRRDRYLQGGYDHIHQIVTNDGITSERSGELRAMLELACDWSNNLPSFHRALQFGRCVTRVSGSNDAQVIYVVTDTRISVFVMRDNNVISHVSCVYDEDYNDRAIVNMCMLVRRLAIKQVRVTVLSRAVFMERIHCIFRVLGHSDDTPNCQYDVLCFDRADWPRSTYEETAPLYSRQTSVAPSAVSCYEDPIDEACARDASSTVRDLGASARLSNCISDRASVSTAMSLRTNVTVSEIYAGEGSIDAPLAPANATTLMPGTDVGGLRLTAEEYGTVVAHTITPAVAYSISGGTGRVYLSHTSHIERETDFAMATAVIRETRARDSYEYPGGDFVGYRPFHDVKRYSIPREGVNHINSGVRLQEGAIDNHGIICADYDEQRAIINVIVPNPRIECLGVGVHRVTYVAGDRDRGEERVAYLLASDTLPNVFALQHALNARSGSDQRRVYSIGDHCAYGLLQALRATAYSAPSIGLRVPGHPLLRAQREAGEAEMQPSDDNSTLDTTTQVVESAPDDDQYDPDTIARAAEAAISALPLGLGDDGTNSMNSSVTDSSSPAPSSDPSGDGGTRISYEGVVPLARAYSIIRRWRSRDEGALEVTYDWANNTLNPTRDSVDQFLDHYVGRYDNDTVISSNINPVERSADAPHLLRPDTVSAGYGQLYQCSLGEHRLSRNGNPDGPIPPQTTDILHAPDECLYRSHRADGVCYADVEGRIFGHIAAYTPPGQIDAASLEYVIAFLNGLTRTTDRTDETGFVIPGNVGEHVRCLRNTEVAAGTYYVVLSGHVSLPGSRATITLPFLSPGFAIRHEDSLSVCRVDKIGRLYLYNGDPNIRMTEERVADFSVNEDVVDALVTTAGTGCYQYPLLGVVSWLEDAGEVSAASALRAALERSEPSLPQVAPSLAQTISLFCEGRSISTLFPSAGNLSGVRIIGPISVPVSPVNHHDVRGTARRICKVTQCALLLYLQQYLRVSGRDTLDVNGESKPLYAMYKYDGLFINITTNGYYLTFDTKTDDVTTLNASLRCRINELGVRTFINMLCSLAFDAVRGRFKTCSIESRHIRFYTALLRLVSTPVGPDDEDRPLGVIGILARLVNLNGGRIMGELLGSVSRDYPMSNVTQLVILNGTEDMWSQARGLPFFIIRPIVRPVHSYLPFGFNEGVVFGCTGSRDDSTALVKSKTVPWYYTNQLLRAYNGTLADANAALSSILNASGNEVDIRAVERITEGDLSNVDADLLRSVPAALMIGFLSVSYVRSAVREPMQVYRHRAMVRRVNGNREVVLDGRTGSPAEWCPLFTSQTYIRSCNVRERLASCVDYNSGTELEYISTLLNQLCEVTSPDLVDFAVFADRRYIQIDIHFLRAGAQLVNWLVNGWRACAFTVYRTTLNSNEWLVPRQYLPRGEAATRLASRSPVHPLGFIGESARRIAETHLDRVRLSPLTLQVDQVPIPLRVTYGPDVPQTNIPILRIGSQGGVPYDLRTPAFHRAIIWRRMVNTLELGSEVPCTLRVRRRYGANTLYFYYLIAPPLHELSDTSTFQLNHRYAVYLIDNGPERARLERLAGRLYLDYGCTPDEGDDTVGRLPDPVDTYTAYSYLAELFPQHFVGYYEHESKQLSYHHIQFCISHDFDTLVVSLTAHDATDTRELCRSYPLTLRSPDGRWSWTPTLERRDDSIWGGCIKHNMNGSVQTPMRSVVPLINVDPARQRFGTNLQPQTAIPVHNFLERCHVVLSAAESMRTIMRAGVLDICEMRAVFKIGGDCHVPNLSCTGTPAYERLWSTRETRRFPTLGVDMSDEAPRDHGGNEVIVPRNASHVETAHSRWIRQRELKLIGRCCNEYSTCEKRVTTRHECIREELNVVGYRSVSNRLRITESFTPQPLLHFAHAPPSLFCGTYYECISNGWNEANAHNRNISSAVNTGRATLLCYGPVNDRRIGAIRDWSCIARTIIERDLYTLFERGDPSRYAPLVSVNLGSGWIDYSLDLGPNPDNVSDLPLFNVWDVTLQTLFALARVNFEGIIGEVIIEVSAHITSMLSTSLSTLTGPGVSTSDPLVRVYRISNLALGTLIHMVMNGALPMSYTMTASLTSDELSGPYLGDLFRAAHAVDSSMIDAHYVRGGGAARDPARRDYQLRGRTRYAAVNPSNESSNAANERGVLHRQTRARHLVTALKYRRRLALLLRSQDLIPASCAPTQVKYGGRGPAISVNDVFEGTQGEEVLANIPTWRDSQRGNWVTVGERRLWPAVNYGNLHVEIVYDSPHVRSLGRALCFSQGSIHRIVSICSTVPEWCSGIVSRYLTHEGRSYQVLSRRSDAESDYDHSTVPMLGIMAACRTRGAGSMLMREQGVLISPHGPTLYLPSWLYYALICVLTG